MSDPIDSSSRRSRARGFRIFGWIAVASMLALALLGPVTGGVAALTGAVYTSNVDGSIINANHYDTKADVYLTGGPCNGGSHLAPGDYYFEVLQPAGSGALLSTDAIGNRKFTVGANGFISSTSGTHATGVVNCTPTVTGFTIQLIPYGDSSNGTYKLQVGTASTVEACAGFDPASTTFQFCAQADQKSDNFHVGAVAPTPTPTPTATVPAPTPTPTATVPAPTPTPTATATVGAPTPTPTPTPTGSVEQATGTPGRTPPNTATDIGSTGSASDGWRIPALGLGLLIGTILLLTPSRTVRRRR